VVHIIVEEVWVPDVTPPTAIESRDFH
jgi:hypothetical protein